jgi:hypothetical protein
MNCAEATSLVSEYLDRRLDLNQTADLEEHARSCARCRRQIDELKATISLVSALEPIEAHPDFVVQVNRKIDAAKKNSLFQSLFSPPRIKVPLEVAALLLVSTLAIHFYRQTSQAPIMEALRSPTETAEQRPIEAPKKELQEEKIAPVYAPKSEAKPRPMAETAAAPPSRSGRKQHEGQAASFEKRPDPQIVGQPRALPAPMVQKSETEPARDVARPAPPPPGPLVHEVVAKDPGDYENRVKEILERFGGKLLTRREEAGSILLTVELPQSRQAELVAALREEPSQSERRQERSASSPAGRSPLGEVDRLRSKEPAARAILNLRIRPEK